MVASFGKCVIDKIWPRDYIWSGINLDEELKMNLLLLNKTCSKLLQNGKQLRAEKAINVPKAASGAPPSDRRFGIHREPIR